jgi:hypothetical protein
VLVVCLGMSLLQRQGMWSDPEVIASQKHSTRQWCVLRDAS